MDSQIYQIKKNADLVLGLVKQSCGPTSEFNLESIKYIEGYIERIKLDPAYNEEMKFALINTFGSFLGECIIKNYGGQWKFVHETWAVEFDEKNAVFPFTKTSKQFDSGLTDSISSFFSMIKIIFKK